ncbi:MAG TPA: GntR family transcriptional regulator [Bryobacteraceae bacterium]|nr:GntR family transcriptional regulator [Bryobacteraceae bacterium]
MPTGRVIPHSLVTALLQVTVDKASPTPAYGQIAYAMRRIIEGSPAVAGLALPPERVLCERYGVSRMTLRQALDLLDRDGLITSARGRGTFLSGRRLSKQQQEFRGFSQEMEERGVRPASKLLSLKPVLPDAAAREFFGIPEDAPLWRIERVRLADAVPLALEAAQVPVSLCPDLDRFNLETGSLYRTLEEHYGIRVAQCLEQIAAAQPDARQRRLLEIPRTAAILLIERRTYTDGHVPVEMTTAAFRGDLYRAMVHSSRPKERA